MAPHLPTLTPAQPPRLTPTPETLTPDFTHHLRSAARDDGGSSI